MRWDRGEQEITLHMIYYDRVLKSITSIFFDTIFFNYPILKTHLWSQSEEALSGILTGWTLGNHWGCIPSSDIYFPRYQQSPDTHSLLKLPSPMPIITSSPFWPQFPFSAGPVCFIGSSSCEFPGPTAIPIRCLSQVVPATVSRVILIVSVLFCVAETLFPPFHINLLCSRMGTKGSVFS